MKTLNSGFSNMMKNHDDSIDVPGTDWYDRFFPRMENASGDAVIEMMKCDVHQWCLSNKVNPGFEEFASRAFLERGFTVCVRNSISVKFSMNAKGAKVYFSAYIADRDEKELKEFNCGLYVVCGVSFIPQVTISGIVQGNGTSWRQTIRDGEKRFWFNATRHYFNEGVLLTEFSKDIGDQGTGDEYRCLDALVKLIGRKFINWRDNAWLTTPGIC